MKYANGHHQVAAQIRDAVVTIQAGFKCSGGRW